MAIEFNKLKSPLLGLLDTIQIGKLTGCRVCDVIQDHYEYLIWADKQGLLKFQGLVVEIIAEQAGFSAQQQHYREEIAPYVSEADTIPILENEELWSSRVIDQDDVPF
jgi:hypothetical protein